MATTAKLGNVYQVTPLCIYQLVKQSDLLKAAMKPFVFDLTMAESQTTAQFAELLVTVNEELTIVELETFLIIQQKMTFT